MDASDASRFWSKVIKSTEDECWLWTAGTRKGYGQFYAQGVTAQAHRVAWLLDGRLLTPELTLDHLCGERRCVNVNHLEEVSRGENTRRGKRKITSCPQGHSYDPKNTYLDPRGKRQCRTCMRRRSAEYDRKRKSRQRA